MDKDRIKGSAEQARFAKHPSPSLSRPMNRGTLEGAWGPSPSAANPTKRATGRTPIGNKSPGVPGPLPMSAGTDQEGGAREIPWPVQSGVRNPAREKWFRLRRLAALSGDAYVPRYGVPLLHSDHR